MATASEIERQLRDAILSSGRSLNQLGQAAGVNDAQLSRFMRGERTLTLETVGRLCQVLGLRFCPTEDAGQAEAEAPPVRSPRKADAGQPETPRAKKGRKRKGG